MFMWIDAGKSMTQNADGRDTVFYCSGVSAGVDAKCESADDNQSGLCQLPDELFGYLFAVFTRGACDDDSDHLFGIQIGLALIE